MSWDEDSIETSAYTNGYIDGNALRNWPMPTYHQMRSAKNSCPSHEIYWQNNWQDNLLRWSNNYPAKSSTLSWYKDSRCWLFFQLLHKYFILHMSLNSFQMPMCARIGDNGTDVLHLRWIAQAPFLFGAPDDVRYFVYKHWHHLIKLQFHITKPVSIGLRIRN